MIDTSQYGDEALREHLKDVIEPLKNAPKEQLLERLWSVVTYIASATEHVSEAELQTTLTDVFRESEEMMMTIAEKWRQEGEEIGIQKGEAIGIEKGREKGREEGARIMIVQLLKARFGPVSDELVALLETCEIAQLDALVNIGLEASSPEAFASDLVKLRDQL